MHKDPEPINVALVDHLVADVIADTCDTGNLQNISPLEQELVDCHDMSHKHIQGKNILPIAPLDDSCSSMSAPPRFEEKGKFLGIIRFVPLVVSHSSVLPVIPKIHQFCPSHFATLMLLPFDRLTVSLKTS